MKLNCAAECLIFHNLFARLVDSVDDKAEKKCFCRCFVIANAIARIRIYAQFKGSACYVALFAVRNALKKFYCIPWKALSVKSNFRSLESSVIAICAKRLHHVGTIFLTEISRQKTGTNLISFWLPAFEILQLASARGSPHCHSITFN